MRNLKKVLSLSLALVMLLGMMVVGAGAAEFKDAGSIKNTEAVDVVSGIGVLLGDENKNFNPTGTLSRAEAAVVIAKLDLGEAFGNLATTNASTFTDVPANYWAKPYIDYCAARGLIAGDGAGHFMPNDKVSGVQFGLMVARVLGYEDKAESIGGADWEVKAAALARKAGLTDNVTLGSSAITRDDMAQVAYNALKADMVWYRTPGTEVNTGNGSIIINGTPAEPKNTNTNTLGDGNKNLQLAEEKFPQLKVTKGSDAFERPSTTWTYARTKISEVADASESEWTGKISKASVISGALNVDAGTTAEIYVDGVKQAATKLSGFDVSLTGNGVLTQAWYNDTTKVATVTVINTYVVRATSDYNTTSETLSVSPYGVSLKSSKISNDDVAVSEFKKDDKILVTGSKDDDGKLTVVTAEAATVERDVKISVYKGVGAQKDYVTFGGTKYNYSKNAAYDPDTVYTSGDGYNLQSTSYNMVMDKYGYVIGVEKFSDEVTLDDILFVKEAAKSGFEYLAKVVFMDGTEETITVAGTKKVGGSQYAKVTEDPAADHDALDNNGDISYNRFYQFEKKSNGEYNLLDLADTTRQGKANKTGDAGKKNIVAGDIQPIRSTSSETLVGKTATNSTIFIADGKVYTGVKSTPNVANADVYYLLDSASGNNYILAAVTEGKGVVTVDASEYVYVFTGNGKGMKDEKGNTYYPYSLVIKDGEKVTDFEASVGDKTNGLYQIESYENDYPVLGTAISGGKAGVYEYTGSVAESGISYKEGTVTVTGIGAFGLAEDAKVYLVDKAGKSVDVIDPATVGNLDEGTYEVCAIQNSASDKSVAVMWIIKKEAAVKAVYDSAAQTKAALSTTKNITLAGVTIDVVTNETVTKVVDVLNVDAGIDGTWTAAVDNTNDITLTADKAGEVKAGAAGGVPTAAPTGFTETTPGKDAVKAKYSKTIPDADKLTTDGSLSIGGVSVTISEVSSTNATLAAQLGVWKADNAVTKNADWDITVEGTKVTFTAKTAGALGNDSTHHGPATAPAGLTKDEDGAEAVAAVYTKANVNTMISDAPATQTGSLTIGGHTATVTTDTLAEQLAEFVADWNAHASGKTTWEASVNGSKIRFTAVTAGAAANGNAPSGTTQVTAGADPA